MLPCKVLKLVKSRNVRSRIKHVFNKSVSVSSLLFIVVTSWKLWIFKLTHKEALSPFYPTLFKKIRTRKLPLVRKSAFIIWRQWIYLRYCRDCRDSYCTNRRFMCLSSTYFFRWINSPWIYWVHQWWPKFSEPIRWLEMHYNRGFWVITVGSAYAKRSFTCSSEERICRYTRKHRKAKSMQSSESPVTMVTTCLYSRATSCSESYK